MSIRRMNRALILATTIAAVLLPATASAAPWDTETFRISAGGFFPSTDVQLEVDSSTSDSRDFDFEDELGTDADDTVGRVGGYFRLAKRHRFSADYFKLSTDGSAVTRSDIEFGDLDIPAGSGVDGEFSIAATQLYYSYSFVQNQQVELAASFGLTYLDIEAGVSAFTPTSTIGRASVESSAPVPVIGASIDYAINEKWLLRAMVQGISADVGDYDGSLWSYGAAVEWLPWQNFGFGLAYGGLTGDLEVDSDDWKGAIDVSIDGPFAFVTARF